MASGCREDEGCQFNSLPVLGVAQRTPIKLGTWTGRTDFVIVKMDYFDIVLGMDFLLEHKVIPMPLEKSLVITGSNPTIIQTNTHQPGRVKKMLALQLRQDLSRDELTLATITVSEEGSSSESTSTKVSRSTKYLSPARKINSKVDVISGAKSSATNECHTSEPEVVDFYEQLNDLLTVGSISPSNRTFSDHPRVRERHQANTAVEGGRQRQTSETTHGHVEVPSR